MALFLFTLPDHLISCCTYENCVLRMRHSVFDSSSLRQNSRLNCTKQTYPTKVKKKLFILSRLSHANHYLSLLLSEHAKETIFVRGLLLIVPLFVMVDYFIRIVEFESEQRVALL